MDITVQVFLTYSALDQPAAFQISYIVSKQWTTCALNYKTNTKLEYTYTSVLELSLYLK